VIDASSPVLLEQQAEVERVLEEIGAQGVSQVLVYNKLDRLEPGQRPRMLRDELEVAPGLRVPRVFVSALTGEGLGALREVIAAHAAPVALTSDDSSFTLPDGSLAPAEPRGSFEH
jgi:GTP-binding protein HflX